MSVNVACARLFPSPGASSSATQIQRAEIDCAGRIWRFAGGVFAASADCREVFASCADALANVAAGRSATVLCYGAQQTLFGPDFGGLYDEPDESSVGIAQQLVRGLYDAAGGRVWPASEQLPEGGHAICLRCTRIASHSHASTDLHGAGSASPASPDDLIEWLADAYSRGRSDPGHTVVEICVSHRPQKCWHTVQGHLRLVELDAHAPDDLRRILNALQLVAERKGFPDTADSDLLSRLRLRDVATGQSSCHAVVGVDLSDSSSALQACRLAAYIQQVPCYGDSQRRTTRPNDLLVGSNHLTKVLRQQQRARESSLKSELARREMKAAKTHRGTWGHLAKAGASVVPDAQLSHELGRVMSGLPDTLSSLRALCALVPRSKAAFTQIGGVRALTELVDFASHGGNTSYNAVYTIAALCDEHAAAQEALDCGVLGRVLALLAVCKEDHVREGCAMTVDQLCVADINTDPELRRVIPAFIAILQETENQQVQWRFASALSRILGKLCEQDTGASSVPAGPPHRGLYDPNVLCAKAVELLKSPVKEVQTAAAQLIGVLLEVLGTLPDASLAMRILEQLLTMTTERSVHLPTLASQCVSKLVELPSLAKEFADDGKLRSFKSKCVDSVARACCAGAPVAQFGSALLRVEGQGPLFRTAYLCNCLWDVSSAGGPRQAIDFRSNPQLRLVVQSASPTAITFCMTLNEDEFLGTKPEKIFLGFDVYCAEENDSFAAATGRAVVLDQHAGSPRHLSNYCTLCTLELEPSSLPYCIVPYTDQPGVTAAFSMAIISHDGPISVERADRPHYPIYTSRTLVCSEGVASGGGLSCDSDKIIAGSPMTWRNSIQHMFAVDMRTACFVSLAKPTEADPESPTARSKLLIALVRDDASPLSARRRFVSTAFAPRDESVVTMSKISAQEVTLVADLPPGQYTLLVLHDQPGTRQELVWTTTFSADVQLHSCGSVPISWPNQGGKPLQDRSLVSQFEWPSSFCFRGEVPIVAEDGLSSGRVEAMFAYPQVLLEGDPSISEEPLGNTDVVVILSCPDPDVYLGLTVVFDRKRKKQMLQRLSESDTWMWEREGDMQRTTSFTPLEAEQRFEFNAADDSIILIPTLYEGRTVELTLSIFCGSTAMTVTALNGGETTELQCQLKECPGLLVCGAAVASSGIMGGGHADATGAESMFGSSRPLPVPSHLVARPDSELVVETVISTDDDESDDVTAEGAGPTSPSTSTASPKARSSGSSQHPGANAHNAAGDHPAPHRTAAVAQTAGSTAPSAGEIEVAARASALREASLRADVARAEERAQRAEQELQKAQAAAQEAASIAQSHALVMSEKLKESEALRAENAAAVLAMEQRLARLQGDDDALSACTPKELKEIRAMLEASLEATNARIQMALIAERLQPDLTCPISQEVMHDPVVASDGNSYERSAIASWLLDHDKSPLSGEKLDGVLLPNTRLRAIIAELGLLNQAPVCFGSRQQQGDAAGDRSSAAAMVESDI